MQEGRKETIYLTVQSFRKLQQRSVLHFVHFYTILAWWEREYRHILEVYRRSLGSPHAEVLFSLVFGGQQILPGETKKEFITTGLAHVATASGFNVSLVFSFSLSIFMKILGKRHGFVAAAIAITLYSFLCGFSAPVLRAWIMAMILIMGLVVGRGYSSLYALLWTIWIMLMHQPFYIFSISFQLTVASTIGILCIVPLLEHKHIQEPEKEVSLFCRVGDVLKEGLITTLGVCLVILPIQLYHFGSFSLGGFIANPLLVWMVPMLVYLAMALFPLGLLLPLALTRLIAFPLWFLLEVFLQSIHVLSRVPGSTLEVASPSGWGICIYYLCLGGFAFWMLAETRRE